MPTLRTRIYVDGYNLYYGCLRKTPYKWLDVLRLFEEQILPSILYRLLPEGQPAKMVLDEQCAIKYFTAEIIEKAAKATDSVQSQRRYHNALKAHSKGRLKFILGKFSCYKANQRIVAEDDPDRWPRDCEQVQVWKLEEKKSDVNLALQLYDDALHDALDQIVLVTNDTDLAPAMAMLKERCPHIVRGLVTPTRENQDTRATERQINKALAEQAHWVRTHITQAELCASQLPDVVATARRSSIKPDSWYAKPQHLATLIELAQPIRKGRQKIMKWANTACAALDGQKPITLIESDDGAARVFSYLRALVEERAAKTGQCHASNAHIIDADA